MTIEQKAKAYDEALNWMRELYPGLHGATKEDAEHYFPELRESEDEKMMNQLHSWMMEFGGAEEYAERVFQWLKGLLEKQKEQKPAEWSEDIIRKAVKEVGLTQHQIDWFKTNIFPPKQEWSEEDDWKRKELIQYLEEKGDYRTVWMTWLKSLRPQPHWKPSKEQVDAVRYFVNKHQSEAWAATGQWKEFTALRRLFDILQKLM